MAYPTFCPYPTRLASLANFLQEPDNLDSRLSFLFLPFDKGGKGKRAWNRGSTNSSFEVRHFGLLSILAWKMSEQTASEEKPSEVKFVISNGKVMFYFVPALAMPLFLF